MSLKLVDTKTTHEVEIGRAEIEETCSVCRGTGEGIGVASDKNPNDVHWPKCATCGGTGKILKTVSGTIFHAAAFNWAESNNWLHLASKMVPELEPSSPKADGDLQPAAFTVKKTDHWIQPSEAANLLEMLDRKVKSIDGYDNKRETLASMQLGDLIILGFKIHQLSNLTEAEGKN